MSKFLFNVRSVIPNFKISQHRSKMLGGVERVVEKV